MRIFFVLCTLGWFVFVFINAQKLNPFLAVFIISAALERFWETFLASKQNLFDKRCDYDWLFKLLSYYYLIIMFGTVIESILLPKRLSWGLSTTGAAAFAAALLLRLWAIRSLGGSWNTLVLGRVKRRLTPKRIVQSGPYRFLRHPIYLGAIAEAASIPAVFNAYYTLIFVFVLYVPLLIVRAFLEEAELNRIFGRGYARYRKKTVGF